MMAARERRLSCALSAVLLLGSCASRIVDGPGRSYTLVNARDAAVVLSGPSAGRRSCDCAMVHVDGFDNSLSDARLNFERVGAAYGRTGGRCEMYGFAWRSDPGILFLRRAEREADQHAGGALADFLDSLVASCPERRVSLTAHSLGARVALRALARRAGRTGARVLETVALVAPAVPISEVLPGGSLHDGISGTRRLLVLHNSEDYVQGLFYPLLTRGRQSIGQHGLRRALAVVEAAARGRGVELRELDAAELWGPRHSAAANLDERFWALYFNAGG